MYKILHIPTNTYLMYYREDSEEPNKRFNIQYQSVYIKDEIIAKFQNYDIIKVNYLSDVYDILMSLDSTEFFIPDEDRDLYTNILLYEIEETE